MPKHNKKIKKQRHKSKTTAKQTTSLAFFLNLLYCLCNYLTDFTEDFDKRHHCWKIKLHDSAAKIVVLWAISVGIYERIMKEEIKYSFFTDLGNTITTVRIILSLTDTSSSLSPSL